MRTALRQVVGVFAELERRMVVKRLRDGRSAKTRAGRKAVGSYAFGTQAGGVGRTRDAIPEPSEEIVVQRIVHMRKHGASFRAIADLLNAEAIPAKRGGSWHPMTVRSVELRYRGD
jgi:DNA invertase Pin-like site-specific DNA recombinase